MTYNFGEVLPGITVSHVFKLKNTSEERIIIDRVKSGCACTIAEITKTDIKPNEFTEITLGLNTKSLSGNVEKGVFVFYRCLNEEYIKRLSLKGIVVAGRRVTPDYIDFGIIEPGIQVVKKLNIQGFNQDFKILDVKSPSYYEINVFQEPKTSLPEYAVSIILKPQAKEGRFSDYIFFETNSKEQPIIQVLAKGKILSQVRFEPEALLLEYNEKTHIFEGVANIVGVDEEVESIRIETIEGPFKVEPFFQKEKGFAYLKISLKDKGIKDNIQGKVSAELITKDGIKKIALSIYCLNL